MKNLDHNSAQYKALLLGILCAVCGLLLSVVNAVTAPIIEANAIAAVKKSLEEIYPGGSFKDVTEDLIAKDETGLIDGIYEAEGQGYVFTLHGVGYNSNGLTFMVGFNNDGTVSGYKALEQQETSGVGSRCFDDDYSSQIMALTSSDPVPLLSGATLTSTAVSNGINAAKAIFNDVQGISYDPDAAPAAPEKEAQKPLGEEDFSKSEVTCEEVSNDGTTAVYHCSAKGFEGINEADVTVNVTDGTIVSIAVTSFGDTAGVGDTATTDAELARYAGASASTVVDATTGASFTSTSIRAMAAAALNVAAGKEPVSGGSDSGSASAGTGLATEDFSANEAGCRVWSNLDSSAYVYKCHAKGYEGVNEATITLNKDEGTVTSVEVTAFKDTAGVGDKATSAEELAKYAGVSLDSSIDAATGASYTSASIRAMIAAALNMAEGN